MLFRPRQGNDVRSVCECNVKEDGDCTAYPSNFDFRLVGRLTFLQLT